MTSWMRRRIERSRARCEKTSTTYRTDKPRTQEPKERPDEKDGPHAQEACER